MMRRVFLVVALLTVLAAGPVAADLKPDPLFVNLTTDEGHRLNMALKFSTDMLDRGHPVVLWLNDRGVLLADTEKSAAFAEQQAALANLISKGATVLVCPYCAKHYGVKETNLVNGAKMSNPDLTSSLLFKDDTQTLSW